LRLREEERIHIAGRLREKASIRTIAAELGRSPSIISRHAFTERRPFCRYVAHASRDDGP
jgi:IS30 family transposase